MKKSNIDKKPTWTYLVLKHLEAQPDNFMTAAQLRSSAGANCDQMSAALIHLRKRHAIDCVVEPDGVAWWFATTQYDDRCRHCDERVIEELGHRRRRKSSGVIQQVRVRK